MVKLGGFGHYDLSFFRFISDYSLWLTIQFEAALQCFDHFVGQMYYTDDPYGEM